MKSQHRFQSPAVWSTRAGGALTLAVGLLFPAQPAAAAGPAPAAGSTCSVALHNENPMTPIAHYAAWGGASASWTKHYSPQQVVVPAAGTVTMTFTQRLSCDPIARQRSDVPHPPQQ